MKSDDKCVEFVVMLFLRSKVRAPFVTYIGVCETVGPSPTLKIRSILLFISLVNNEG